MSVNAQPQTQDTVPSTTEATPQVTTPASSTPAVNPSTATTPPPSPDPTSSPEAQAAAAAAQAEYKANLTYEVSKQKKQFDEVFKEVIKNEAQEKKLRELYEKADGLDIVKQSRDSFKNRFEEYQKQWQPVEQDLKTVGKYLQAGDLDNFFKMFQVPEQKVVDWMAQKIQYNQMSPEERARVDNLRQVRGENYRKSDEVETLRQSLEKQEVQHLTFQLDMLRETQKYADAAAAFDERLGKPGSFEEKLFDFGELLSQRNGGQTVPPKQVFEMMVKEYGLEGQAPTPGAPPQARTVVTTPPVEKPTVTQIKGSKTATPVKRQFRSIKDLETYQKELSGGKFTPGS
jgi:hypothetical protein